MSTVHILYAGNDTILQLDGLQADAAGAFLSNAQVLVTLSDDQGNPVNGAAWPVSMVYLTGSRGLYRVTLPFTLDLQPGRRYVADITADAGPGLHAEWTLDCVARARQ